MMYRSQTDTMLAAKFDPEPWMVDGFRGDKGWADSQRPWANAIWLDPRPEFIPYRNADPVPWVARFYPDGAHRVADPAGPFAEPSFEYVYKPRASIVALRPEPNPILIALRTGILGVDEWLDAFNRFDTYGGTIDWDLPSSDCHALTIATPEQIEHARRVLARLATLT